MRPELYGPARAAVTVSAETNSGVAAARATTWQHVSNQLQTYMTDAIRRSIRWADEDVDAGQNPVAMADGAAGPPLPPPQPPQLPAPQPPRPPQLPAPPPPQPPQLQPPQPPQLPAVAASATLWPAANSNVAVAADANSNGDHEDEDEDGSDNESVGGRSGDTAGSRTDDEVRKGDLAAVAARRTDAAQPGFRIAGDKHPWREPAERNQRFDVGNFSMFVGNWGERSSVEGFAQRDLHDANVKGSPGELVVLFEANHSVAALLESKPSYVQEPPQQRSLPNQKAVPGNMWQREHYEHHVILTSDSKNAILMAARTNVCEEIEQLHTASWCDGTWRVNGKLKTATTRVMICKFKWKQNIGHLGNEVTVMGVHGHYKTMNMYFAAKVNNELWSKIHALIVEHNVNFLVGDWNMSLPQVVPRLSELGLRVDLCAWYPWLHETQEKDGFYFGMDSCAMFYIGGDVACQLIWDYYSIGDILKDAACDPKQRPRSRQYGPVFDVYCGEKNGETCNVPGKLWDKFKNKKK